MKRALNYLQLNLLESWWMVAIQYTVFFFSPIAWLTLGVGFFVAFDWVTGIVKAKKKNIPITSGGFFRTFVKFAMYSIAIISTRVLELLLHDKMDIPFASLLAGFIIVMEYKSIMENISEVVGVNLWEFIKDKVIKIKK